MLEKKYPLVRVTQDKEISEKIEEYRRLAAENEGVDLAALAMSAMGEVKKDEIDTRKRRRAYLISVLLPPLGVFYFLKYFWSGKVGGRKVAMMSLVLTAGALLVSLLIAGAMFADSGVTGEQIRDVEMEDLESLFL